MSFMREYSDKYQQLNIIPQLLVRFRRNRSKLYLHSNSNVISPASNIFNSNNDNMSRNFNFNKWKRLNYSYKKKYKPSKSVKYFYINLLDNEIEDFFVDESLLGSYKDISV